MVNGWSYLIRYGVMSHVGRFSASPDGGSALERGQSVVIRTDRGVELGEVLIALEASEEKAGSSLARPDSPRTLASPAPTTFRDRGIRKNCGQVAFPFVNACSGRGTGRGSSSTLNRCSMAARGPSLLGPPPD